MKPLIVPVLLFVIAISAVCPVAAESDGEVVTEPIRTFGLGTLEAAAYSPDGQHISALMSGVPLLSRYGFTSCPTSDAIRRVP